MKLRKMKVPETLLELLVTMHVGVKNAMRNRSSLVNSDETRMYWAILPELGCIGFPDLVDCTKGTPVVVERKKRILGKIPSEPYDSNKLQLLRFLDQMTLHEKNRD